jgi:hypothetical protein
MIQELPSLQSTVAVAAWIWVVDSHQTKSRTTNAGRILTFDLQEEARAFAPRACCRPGQLSASPKRLEGE